MDVVMVCGQTVYVPGLKLSKLRKSKQNQQRGSFLSSFMELSSQEELCVILPVPQPGVCRGHLNSWAFIWWVFVDY